MLLIAIDSYGPNPVACAMRTLTRTVIRVLDYSGDLGGVRAWLYSGILLVNTEGSQRGLQWSHQNSYSAEAKLRPNERTTRTSSPPVGNIWYGIFLFYPAAAHHCGSLCFWSRGRLLGDLRLVALAEPLALGYRSRANSGICAESQRRLAVTSAIRFPLLRGLRWRMRHARWHDARGFCASRHG